MVVIADGLPATAFQQRIQPVSPATNSGRYWHNLHPVIIKTDIQRAFQQTDAVYRRRWLNLASTAPLTAAEDVIHPVVLLRQLQRVGQAKKIVLLGQFTGTAAPEIIQLMAQSRTNAERPALVEYPVNIAVATSREKRRCFFTCANHRVINMFSCDSDSTRPSSLAVNRAIRAHHAR